MLRCLVPVVYSGLCLACQGSRELASEADTGASVTTPATLEAGALNSDVKGMAASEGSSGEADASVVNRSEPTEGDMPLLPSSSSSVDAGSESIGDSSVAQAESESLPFDVQFDAATDAGDAIERDADVNPQLDAEVGDADAGPQAQEIDDAGSPQTLIAVGPVSFPQEGVCSLDDWCWVNPVTTGNNLWGLHAFSETDVWAVGEQSTVLHYDGQSWSGFTGYNEVTYLDIWGAGSGEFWLAGSKGTLHFDGSQLWLDASAPRNLRALDGMAADDIWGVGEDGVTAHYDGTGWTEYPSLSENNFNALWMVATDDIWAGGDGGKLFHFDGSVWTEFTYRSQNIYDIWGSASDDFWIVTDAYWWHRQDEAWTIGEIPDVGSRARLAGLPGQQPWAFGTYGAAHLDGEWQLWESPQSFSPRVGAMVDGDTIWVAGDRGGLALFDEGAWVPQRDLSFETTEPLNAVAGTSETDVWVVGGRSSAGSIRHFDGEQWTREDVGDDNFVSVRAFSPTDVYAATFDGLLAHYDGSDWSFVEGPGVGRIAHLGGLAPDKMWAVGSCSLSLFDGVVWAEPVKYDCTDINSMAMSAYSELILVVGRSGKIYQLENNVLVQQTSPTQNGLNHVLIVNDEEAWAVGDSGTIVRYNGRGWALLPSLRDADYPGQLEPTGFFSDLNQLWSNGEGELWAAGNQGSILHYDGTSWQHSISGASGFLNGIWGVTGQRLWAVGSFGTLISLDLSAATETP